MMKLQKVTQEPIAESQLPDTAVLEDSVEQILDPDADDTLWFSFRKGDQTFKIGLSDLLSCIKFAEEQKELPELPWQWWSQVVGVYPKLDFILADTLRRNE